MMLAAGALVRSVLAAGAVGFAWYACAVLGIYVKRCQNSRVALLDFKKTELVKRSEYEYELICSLPHTFVVALGALLKADCQISDPKVSGGARETRVLTCPRANFTGFMTWPANAALIREAPWRATTDASAEKEVRDPSRCF